MLNKWKTSFSSFDLYANWLLCTLGFNQTIRRLPGVIFSRVYLVNWEASIWFCNCIELLRFSWCLNYSANPWGLGQSASLSLPHSILKDRNVSRLSRLPLVFWTWELQVCYGQTSTFLQTFLHSAVNCLETSKVK